MFTNCFVNIFDFGERAAFKTIFLFALFTFCYACNFSNETSYYLNHPKPIPSLHYLTLTTSNQTSFSYQNKNTESSNTTEIGMLYEYSKDSLDNLQLTLTYDKITIETESSKAGKQTFSTDEEKHPSEMSHLLALLKGRSIIIHYDSTGKPRRISGVEEAVNAALDAIPPGATEMRKAVQDQLINFVGADFVRNTLQPAGQLFPDSAVRTGDSWSHEITQQAAIPIRSTSRFTVASLKDSVAVLDMESTIKNDRPTPLVISGYKMNAQLTGTQTGEFRTDMRTGILTNAITETKLDGDVQILGKSVPLTVLIKKELKLTKKN